MKVIDWGSADWGKPGTNITIAANGSCWGPGRARARSDRAVNATTAKDPTVIPDQIPGRLLPAPIALKVTPEDVDRVAQPTRMLLAIAATGKHMYEGTAPPAVKARRRAANKAARKARRVTR